MKCLGNQKYMYGTHWARCIFSLFFVEIRKRFAIALACGTKKKNSRIRLRYFHMFGAWNIAEKSVLRAILQWILVSIFIVVHFKHWTIYSMEKYYLINNVLNKTNENENEQKKWWFWTVSLAVFVRSHWTTVVCFLEV